MHLFSFSISTQKPKQLLFLQANGNIDLRVVAVFTVFVWSKSWLCIVMDSTLGTVVKHVNSNLAYLLERLS